MNTTEALALVIAEQRAQIHELEIESDLYDSKAKRFETQFLMTNDALIETREALRLCGAEVAELKRRLSEYEDLVEAM